MTLGWLRRRVLRHPRGPRHGRGRLQLSDGGRPLLLGGQAGADEAGANRARWSWFTGWFNLVGQVAVTAGIDFGLATFTQAFLNYLFGYPLDPPYLILIYGVVLVIHALLNTFGIRIVALLNNVSVWWHL